MLLAVLSFTATVGWWVVPAAITVFFVILAIEVLRNGSGGMFDFTPLLALLCMMPVGFVWAVYFAIAYSLK